MQSSAADGPDSTAFSRRSSTPPLSLLPQPPRGKTARLPRSRGRARPVRGARDSPWPRSLPLVRRRERKRMKKRKKAAGTWNNVTLTAPVCHRVGTTRASQKLALLQPLPAPRRSQGKCLRNCNTLKWLLRSELLLFFFTTINGSFKELHRSAAHLPTLDERGFKPLILCLRGQSPTHKGCGGSRREFYVCFPKAWATSQRGSRCPALFSMKSEPRHEIFSHEQNTNPNS